MPRIGYTIITGPEESSVTAIVPGEPQPQGCHSSQPNFGSIVTLLASQKADDPSTWADANEVLDLFDVSKAVAKRFDSLSERIKVANGTIYLDGDPIHNALTEQILRFMDEGVEDWKPLVAFFEKVQANPNEHSRQQLYDWLDNQHGITISPIGNVVGYKGVTKNANGEFVSIHSGTAIVNGEEVSGQIPNAVGSIIEMPRTQVHHDPASHCSRGLHVGTYQYAETYARGAMLECHVDPRDVVSVPNDAHGEKVRVCRYVIAGTLDAPYNTALLDVDGDCPGVYDWDAAEALL